MSSKGALKIMFKLYKTATLSFFFLLLSRPAISQEIVLPEGFPETREACEDTVTLDDLWPPCSNFDYEEYRIVKDADLREQSDYNFCDGDTTGLLDLYPNCDPNINQLVEIAYRGNYQDVFRVFTPTSTQKFFDSVGYKPNKNSIIQILSEKSCSSVFVDPETLELQIPENINCDIARSIYTNNFSLGTSDIASLDASTIAEKLSGLSIINNNNLTVSVLNKKAKYFLLQTTTPQKNVIIEGFWERVSILLLINDEIVTATIDGQFASGVWPPRSASDYKSTNSQYSHEVQDFASRLKREIESD